MDILQRIYEAFSHILFYEQEHRYFSYLHNRYLTSVTTKLDQYKEPFDRLYWTHYKAYQRSGYEVKWHPSREFFTLVQTNERILRGEISHTLTISPEEIGQEWDDKSNAALDLGSRAHFALQEVAQRRIHSLTPAQEPIINGAIAWGKKAFVHHDCPFIPIACELVIGYGELAGMIDNLSRLKRTGGLYILDYKTDEEIEYENNFQNFLAPLQHIQACNKNKYDLQISMYRRILELSGIEIEGQYIIHFSKVTGAVNVIKAVYLREEADLLIGAHQLIEA